MRHIPLLIATLVAVPGAASAQVLDEARFGVTAHNTCVLYCDNSYKEDGPNLNGEIVLNSPDFLELVWSPRPYAMASVNTAGNTSFAGAGLYWNWDFAGGWSFEPGLGYVVHDGELDFPFPQGDPRGDAFTEENVLLGSRDLFRTSFALNYSFNERWGGQVLYEHLSHGQILGSGRNQGMDNLGVRVIYAFGH